VMGRWERRSAQLLGDLE